MEYEEHKVSWEEEVAEVEDFKVATLANNGQGANDHDGHNDD